MLESAEGGAMRVSVIMTGFNTDAYVDAAIRSVLRSTHRDIELLLIDDGSTDRTGEVMAGWAQSDDRVAFHTLEHGGFRRALAFGHEQATGEVLTWIDSDDLVDPIGIASAVKAIDIDHQLVWTHRRRIDANGKKLGSDPKNNVLYSPIQHLVANMIFHLRLYTREVFTAAGGLSELTSAIDWDLNLRIAEITEPRCVPIELYSYRTRPGQMSERPDQVANGITAVRRAIARRGLDLELRVENDHWQLLRWVEGSDEEAPS
jgi:glycosyltransferase involved in cell wall biosynthesis